jgi:hypothetical protein
MSSSERLISLRTVDTEFRMRGPEYLAQPHPDPHSFSLGHLPAHLPLLFFHSLPFPINQEKSGYFCKCRGRGGYSCCLCCCFRPPPERLATLAITPVTTDDGYHLYHGVGIHNTHMYSTDVDESWSSTPFLITQCHKEPRVNGPS